MFAAWIDKRNVAAAKTAGKPYAGAALAFAWDDKPGGTLEAATIARDNSCECCRIAVAFAGPGKPVVMFRNISMAAFAITRRSRSPTPVSPAALSRE